MILAKNAESYAKQEAKVKRFYDLLAVTINSKTMKRFLLSLPSLCSTLLLTVSTFAQMTGDKGYVQIPKSERMKLLEVHAYPH